jgi:membrane protease YdiL (CAAX protease family)
LTCGARRGHDQSHVEPVAASPDSPPDLPPVPAAPSRAAGRLRALVQVLACSGIPTQLLLVQVLGLAGIRPFTEGDTLNLTWVFLLSLADTVLLGTLICVLLAANGESIRGIFLGPRPALPEVPVGVLSVLPVLVTAAAVLLTSRAVAPWLHNVPVNPLGALMQSPRDIWLFAIVALVAGGIREELQRAFLLTRFEQHLGGARVGLLVTSVAFGLGHLIQGFDAALATGTLGLLWGALYLWRRSAVAPMVSHAGFNSLEIVRFLLVGA